MIQSKITRKLIDNKNELCKFMHTAWKEVNKAWVAKIVEKGKIKTI